MTKGEELGIGIGLVGIVLAYMWSRRTSQQLAQALAVLPQPPTLLQNIDPAMLPGTPVDPITQQPVLPAPVPLDASTLGTQYDPLTQQPIVPPATDPSFTAGFG